MVGHLDVRFENMRQLIVGVIGGCEVDKDYKGPKLPTAEGGKYSIDLDFINAMIQWFKDGKTLPRRYVAHVSRDCPQMTWSALQRYVWEIVLGAHSHFVQEESLVTLNLEEGMTCDVIGDVHGLSSQTHRLSIRACLHMSRQVNSMTCSISIL